MTLPAYQGYPVFNLCMFFASSSRSLVLINLSDPAPQGYPSFEIYPPVSLPQSLITKEVPMILPAYQGYPVFNLCMS